MKDNFKKQTSILVESGVDLLCIETMTDLNEAVIAKKINISLQSLIEKLDYLMQQQVIDYVKSYKGQQVYFIKERLADQNFSIPNKFYNQKKQAAKDKLDAMLGFLETKTCTQIYLLAYFGETTTEKCNKCNKV